MDSIQQLNAALGDRYALEHEVGRGGMATVYLARDLKHDRRVALKVLNPELGAVLGVERFLAEIKVTANLQHPNVLPLFDSGSADGQLYYVMPFVDGETLRTRLEREHQLPVDEAIRITVAVANALEYAHGRGVVHRDLKPENILLQAGQPVIADFGIALAVSNAGGARVTQTGLSLGTPQYMSPEQATGDRLIDARADQYSLAAVLYEMLTGEPPHTGGTAQIIMARLMTETPRPVQATRPSVPTTISAAVSRALMKAPADRFESTAAFARALAVPGAPAAMSAAERAGGFSARRFAAAAAIVALAGTAAWFASRRESAPLQMTAVLLMPTTAGTDASLAPAAARIDDAMAQSIGTLSWVSVRSLQSKVPLDDNAATAAARNAGAATLVTASLVGGGDSAQLRIRVIDAATGTVIRQLPTATLSRNPSAGDALRSVDALTSVVGFVTSPRMGAVTLPSGPLSRAEAFRALDAGLASAFTASVVSLDTTARRTTIDALRHAVALDTTFIQAKLWLGISYRWYLYLSRREGAAARGDSVRRWIDQSREHSTPYETALADVTRESLGDLDDGTVESIRRLLTLSPRSPLARVFPYMLLDLNRPREALAAYDAELRLPFEGDALKTERAVQIWSEVAEVRHMLGEYDASLAAWKKARAVRPGDVLLLSGEMQTLAALGRLDELNRLLLDVPSSASNGQMFGFAGGVYLTVANELTAHGHPAEGKTLMLTALGWFAQHDAEVNASSNVATRKALVLMALGRNDEAIGVLRLHPARDSADARIHGLLGRNYAVLGRTAELKAELAWLEAQPAAALRGTPTIERASIAANLGRDHWDEAVGLLEEALRQGQGYGIRRRLHYFADWLPLKDYPPFKKVLEPKG